MRLPLPLALCALTALAPSLRADEDKAPQAERAIALTGRLGLSGFQDMVDARVPEGLVLRGGVDYRAAVRQADLDGPVSVRIKSQQHDVTLWGGAALLDFVEASLLTSYRFREDVLDRHGAPDPRDRTEDGFGTLDLAGKVSLDLGPLDLAPFLIGRFPTGAPDLGDLYEFEYGLAVGVDLLNHHLGLHGNVSGLQVEGGFQAVRYRAGASFVVLKNRMFLVRLHAYLDGYDPEGSGGSDLDLAAGGQVLLFDLIRVELGVSYRLRDSGTLDDELRDRLAAIGPALDRHLDDEGTWAVTLGAGIVF